MYAAKNYIVEKPETAISLKIAYWNIRGAISRKHKLGEIAHGHNLDVVAFQETLLSEGKSFTLEGYDTNEKTEKAEVEEQQS